MRTYRRSRTERLRRSRRLRREASARDVNIGFEEITEIDDDFGNSVSRLYDFMVDYSDLLDDTLNRRIKNVIKKMDSIQDEISLIQDLYVDKHSEILNS